MVIGSTPAPAIFITPAKQSLTTGFFYAPNRGVLVVDRGFDGWVMFKDWLDNKYRFVARLVGNRHLLRFYSGSGQWLPIRADQLADQTPTGHRFHKLVKRHGKPALRITQIGWVKVRLPGRDEDLTLVVSRLAGVDKPMMLLTNLSAENLKDAKNVCCVSIFEGGNVKKEFAFSRAR